MTKSDKASKVTEEVKNTAPQAFEDEKFDETGAEEEQIGFPPYWKPSNGRKFKAKVIALDERDPMFPRWVLQSTHNIACESGPADDAEPRLVKAGEFFTMSLYAALPLERYFGCDVIVEAKEERDLQGGKSLWVFGLKITPETKQIVEARRAKKIAIMKEKDPTLLDVPDMEDVYIRAMKRKAEVEEQVKAAKRV